MDNRTTIPALALLGLSFTGCPGDDAPNPIVGEWGAIQFDGDKLPMIENSGPYSAVFGLQMTVEDELSGELEYYADYDYGDYESHGEYGTDIVVDDSEAPKYRIELVRDLFGGGDVPYYYDTVGTAVSSDGYSGGYIGDSGDGTIPVNQLAAPIRPDLAPAELVLTCTLDQDTLSCETDEDTPVPMIFKKRKPKPDGD